MTHDYTVLAATYGKLRGILNIAELSRRQKMSMAHAMPTIAFPDDFETLVLLDKAKQLILLSTGDTFSADDINMTELLKLPVYGGEYTISYSAFHGLQIKRGLGHDQLYLPPFQSIPAQMNARSVPAHLVPEQVNGTQQQEQAAHVTRMVLSFKEEKPDVAVKNRIALLTEFYNRMKMEEADASKNHVPVHISDVLEAGKVFNPESVLMLTEEGGLVCVDRNKCMTYMKYDVHAKRFHTVWTGY